MTHLPDAGRRLVRIVASFLLVTFGTMFLMSLVPGDPARFIAGDGAPDEVINVLNERYHFNDPIIVRYWYWLGDLLHGDLGVSYAQGRPVVDMIKERLPVTLELAVLGMLLALVLAIPLAVATARRAGSRLDRGVGGVSSGVISIPSFALALVLAYLFAYQWTLFPIFGWTPLTEDPWENLRSAVLPVVAIAAAQSVILMRVLRADLLETLQQDYIALGRSKGVSARAIMWKHALKPSSFSLLTLIGLTFAQMLGGTVIVESIFLLPGLGTLIIEAIGRQDLVVIQGVVVFIAAAFLLLNLLVDVLYGVLDPRTRGHA
jgi:peptide/nickel transport system permease protein